MGSGQAGEEHEGERFLRLIGMENVADQDIVMGGVTRKGRDFLEDERCASLARPALMGFESMDPDDPRRETTLQALKSAVTQYLGTSPEIR